MEGYYHVWFSTKRRKAALQGDVGDDVKRLLTEIAQSSGIRLLEVEAMVDHAHLLVELAGTQTLSNTMHQLKGASARSIFLKYPELKLDMGTGSFWQRGYGWRKVDPAELAGIRIYIRTQRQRPHRRNL